jgi:hypothetical protein
MSEQATKVVGRCHKCNGPVRTGGHEGRLACDSCGLPTDNCTCSPGS